MTGTREHIERELARFKEQKQAIADRAAMRREIARLWGKMENMSALGPQS